ncbi:hypothetical protein L226DRAFT_433533, partial [Lentinus tigrinus ALCF2SS1-7]
DGASQRRIVTVKQFLVALLGQTNFDLCAGSLPRAVQNVDHSQTTLVKAFEGAFIYFNHFIKAQSYDVVNQEYLLLAISRGAAIICADGNVGIDIVVPVLFGTELKKDKVTAILIQSQNSRHYKAKIQYPVFMNMNPYRCGLFDRDVKESPPVLRMVFALASPTPAVSSPVVADSEQRSPRTQQQTAKFTAYEIWCAGASHETFAVVQKDEDAAFAALLKMMRDGRDVLAQQHYSEGIRRVLRQMQPLVSTHPDNISLFAEIAPNMEEIPLADDAEE